MTVTKTHLIFLAIYTAVVVFITWYFVNPQPTNDNGLTTESQQMIDSLAREINILEYRQYEKDSLIANYKGEIDSLDTQIVTLNNKVIKIKKEYEKEIIYIRNYTTTELNEFFTERYK